MPLEELQKKAKKIEEIEKEINKKSTKLDENDAVNLAQARDAFWTAAYHLPELKPEQTLQTTTPSHSYTPRS